MKTILTTFILLLFNLFLLSQDKQKEFIEALINGDENLESYIDKKELSRSNRLGINYDSVKYKFMISYDIDDEVREEIHNNKLKYDLEFINLKYNFSMIKFDIRSLNYSKNFYFRYNKLISPSTYFTDDWTTQESKYFIFKISEPKYFNDYCVNKLDKFVDSICTILEIEQTEREQLKQEKIYYILCKDEDEIENVTGFKTRGIYVTAYDEVITTYNTHYHELAHLLMNYKLKNLSLYTLPFFQEGFAVAVGGRGGMSPRVVTDIGYYLQKTGLLTYDSIITNDGFYKEDASLTYPVAGLYNSFLLKEQGAKKYIDLYKKVNGDLGLIETLTTSDLTLPVGERFDDYLVTYGEQKLIRFDAQGFFSRSPNECVEFGELDSFYCFNVKCSTMSLYPENAQKWYEINAYESRLFTEITGQKCNGAIYLLSVDSSYVKVYDCFSNELIFSYDVNFSLDHFQVPTQLPETYEPRAKPPRRYYYFSLSKLIFDRKFSDMLLLPAIINDSQK